MSDLIERQEVLDWLNDEWDGMALSVFDGIRALPSAQPERLTDDDFETIRIHLSAYKERLCNQHRCKEAEEYQRIIDRFISFASAQQTLFGYKIEHLAYIAKVMEKEGITAECAVRTFDDMSRAIRMIIEEAQQKAGEMLNERFNQQAGGD